MLEMTLFLRWLRGWSAFSLVSVLLDKVLVWRKSCGTATDFGREFVLNERL